MASVSKVSILDYFNIVFEGENGKIESNCKACGTRIQAKRSVTSNFVTHLKVILELLLEYFPFYISTALCRHILYCSISYTVFPYKGLNGIIICFVCHSITLFYPMLLFSHSEETPGHV